MLNNPVTNFFRNQKLDTSLSANFNKYTHLDIETLESGGKEYTWNLGTFKRGQGTRDWNIWNKSDKWDEVRKDIGDFTQNISWQNRDFGRYDSPGYIGWNLKDYHSDRSLKTHSLKSISGKMGFKQSSFSLMGFNIDYEFKRLHEGNFFKDKEINLAVKERLDNPLGYGEMKSAVFDNKDLSGRISSLNKEIRSLKENFKRDRMGGGAGQEVSNFYRSAINEKQAGIAGLFKEAMGDSGRTYLDVGDLSNSVFAKAKQRGLLPKNLRTEGQSVQGLLSIFFPGNLQEKHLGGKDSQYQYLITDRLLKTNEALDTFDPKNPNKTVQEFFTGSQNKIRANNRISAANTALRKFEKYFDAPNRRTQVFNISNSLRGETGDAEYANQIMQTYDEFETYLKDMPVHQQKKFIKDAQTFFKKNEATLLRNVAENPDEAFRFKDIVLGISRDKIVNTKNFLKKAGIVGGAIIGISALMSLGGRDARRDQEKSLDRRVPYRIEALHPKVGPLSRWNRNTGGGFDDFGSGWLGGVAQVTGSNAHPNDPHPELSPQTPKGSYRYLKMAPSSIGLKKWELYKHMTEQEGEMPEYVQASAGAGTAFHRYMEGQMLRNGEAASIEQLTVDPVFGLAGYMDVIDKQGRIGDIKTMSPGRFEALKKRGSPYPSHSAQLRAYQAMTGLVDQPGFIDYYNIADPSQHIRMDVQFNSEKYLESMENLMWARRQVKKKIASGELYEADLPKASSIAELKKADVAHQEEIANIVDNQDQAYQDYQDELAWLQNTKRGMPQFLLKNRQQNANENEQRKQRQYIRNQQMGNHIGEAQAYFNNRSKHHIQGGR